MKAFGWYTETTPGSGVFGRISKIHWTDDGRTAICGAKPGRHAIFDIVGGDACHRCDLAAEKRGAENRLRGSYY